MCFLCAYCAYCGEKETEKELYRFVNLNKTMINFTNDTNSLKL